jgi:DNA polymerase III subunit beta
MKFSIKRKDIRAMLHLTAKKDLRYYLQGMNIVRDNRGTYIEATDGHIMGRLLIDGIKSDTKQSVILPSEALQKLKGTKKQGDEWLSFSVEGLAVECIDSQSTTRFSAHEARFPDIDRIIPMMVKAEDIQPSTFNPDLVSRFVDVSEELYGKRQIPQILQRGNQSALVGFPQMDDAFIGVLMPCREYGTPKVPEWCIIPSTKPVQTTETA